MRQDEAFEAAGVAMDLALEVEAGLDPELLAAMAEDGEWREAHALFLATSVLEAVGALHGVAAFVASLIEDGAPEELVGLRRRLRSVGEAEAETEAEAEAEVVAELGAGWRIERRFVPDQGMTLFGQGHA